VENLKLNSWDKLIYDARVSGIGLFEYEENDMNTTILDLVLRISVISGANLPQNDNLIEMLESELKKSLIAFKFTNLSIDEVLLAFRFNCVTDCYIDLDVEVNYVQPPTNLNVDYILKVLYNYRKHRHSFERKIQNKLDGYNG